MFEVKKYPQRRTRKVFSWFGFISVATLEWSGKFFKYVEIEEQLTEVRYSYFDEWIYQNRWGEWEQEWIFKKFL